MLRLLLSVYACAPADSARFSHACCPAAHARACFIHPVARAFTSMPPRIHVSRLPRCFFCSGAPLLKLLLVDVNLAAAGRPAGW
eukprot:10649014-Alexandrium_andersonii.AAC.1